MLAFLLYCRLFSVLQWQTNSSEVKVNMHSALNSFEPLLFVGCLTPQQHVCVSQGWICSDSCMCCHTEIEVADQTFYLILSQYADTWPTSLSTDPITPGAWQGSHCSTNVQITGMTWPWKRSTLKAAIKPRFAALEADALTTRPAGWCRL